MFPNFLKINQSNQLKVPCPGTQPHGIDSRMTTARKYRITSNNTQLSITYHTTHLPLDELSLGHGMILKSRYNSYR